MSAAILQALVYAHLTVRGELPEDLKTIFAICAGVPYRVETFTVRPGTITVKYTTTVPCDVRLVDGRVMVFQQRESS